MQFLQHHIARLATGSLSCSAGTVRHSLTTSASSPMRTSSRMSARLEAKRLASGARSSSVGALAHAAWSRLCGDDHHPLARDGAATAGHDRSRDVTLGATYKSADD